MTISLFDIRTEKLINNINLNKKNNDNKLNLISALDIIDNNKFIAGGSFNPKIFDLRNIQKDLDLFNNIESLESINQKAFICHSKNKIFYTRSNNRETKIIDICTLEQVHDYQKFYEKKNNEYVTTLDVKIFEEEILWLVDIRTFEHDDIRQNRKMLAKLKMKHDGVKIVDFIEVPSFSKRVNISGPDNDIIIEGNNQIGIWKYRYKEIEEKLKNQLEEKLMALLYSKRDL